MPKVKYLENPKPYSCQDCQLGFTSEFARDRHRNTIHCKNKNEFYVCSVQNCGESFPRKDYLQRHQKNIHKMGRGRDSGRQGNWTGLAAAVWKLTGQRRGPRVKRNNNGFFRRGKKLKGNPAGKTSDHRPSLNVTIGRRRSIKNGGGDQVKKPVHPPPKPANALIPELAKALPPEPAQVLHLEPLFEESDQAFYPELEVDSEPENLQEHFSREMFPSIPSDIEVDSESEEIDDKGDDSCFLCLDACGLAQEEHEEFNGSFEFHKFVHESLQSGSLQDFRTDDIFKMKTCRTCQRKIEAAMAKALDAEENQMRIRRLKKELEKEEASLEENQKAYQKSINKIISVCDQVDAVKFLEFADKPQVPGDLIGRVRKGLTSLASFSQFSQSQVEFAQESTPEVAVPADEASGDGAPVNVALENIENYPQRNVDFSPASIGSVDFYSETDVEELEKKRVADISNKTGR